MSIDECSNLVLGWFKDKGSVFTLDKANEIIAVAEETEERDATIKASLEFLDTLDLIKKTVFREKEYWILKKRVESFSQTVEINEELAIAIAKEVNQFCDIINDHSDVCTAAQILEKDIKNLLLMYVHAKERVCALSSEKEVDA